MCTVVYLSSFFPLDKEIEDYIWNEVSNNIFTSKSECAEKKNPSKFKV